jgi:hypothetical protein
VRVRGRTRLAVRSGSQDGSRFAILHPIGPRTSSREREILYVIRLDVTTCAHVLSDPFVGQASGRFLSSTMFFMTRVEVSFCTPGRVDSSVS